MKTGETFEEKGQESLEESGKQKLAEASAGRLRLGKEGVWRERF